MPYASPKPCRTCGKLGCMLHKRQSYSPPTSTPESVAPAPKRPSAAARGYGNKWQSARAGYLAKHPVCVLCKAAGYGTPATVVDHIIPHRGDMALFWDSQNNWRALCRPCHGKKTANEDMYRGADGRWGSGKA